MSRSTALILGLLAVTACGGDELAASSTVDPMLVYRTETGALQVTCYSRSRDHMNYLKYALWVVVGAISLWSLYLIAAYGNPWISAGIVGFVAFIALFNKATKKPSPRTGQPSPKRRVTSTDRDRWGGGTL